MPESAKRAADRTTVALGDVVRQVKDRVDPEQSGLERYVAGEHMDTDDLRLRRWGEIGDGYLGPAFHMRFKPGHVLYGSRRTYLRKVAVADFEGITANTTYVLEPKDPNVLSPELLPFIMQTEAFNQHSVRESKGSVNPYVNFSDLAWYEFALPLIQEQRRIASVLSAVDRVIHRNGELRDSLGRVQSSITEAFLAKQRHSRRFADIIDSTAYGTSARSSSDGAGVPVLGIPNVRRGRLSLDEFSTVELSDADVARYNVATGDLLLVRTNGNPDYVGRCVVVDGLPHPFVYASYLIRIRVDQRQVSPSFVAAVLNAPSLRRAIRATVRSSAGNYNINTDEINALRIPTPPLTDQRALLAEVDAVRSQQEELGSRLLHVVELKARMLKACGL